MEDLMQNKEYVFNLNVQILKQKLADSDYKVLKYLEGELSQEEYDEIVAARKEWRRKINELEEQNKEKE